ncbi:MAG: tRNA (N6-threonylcarbamoyladenosine(37)-N6)-methyltransferase TrmO [Clostridia bacterium]|nr:tRNA (N6-threonylcarbamoyladenosine(37)-N6)-methyltransferase TrmO [Clostridia bacterium]
MKLETIAHIRTDFPDKFGLPRQSGIVPGLSGTIVFEKEYRNPDALRGLEGYSHLWIIWGFSGAFASSGESRKWSPTVRPPRLGGNRRMGVFATRSPNRPNPIGLSCVKLESVEYGTDAGAVIHVSGIDMMDGTPIYDIKPYLPHADCQPDALGGFSSDVTGERVEVVIPDALLAKLPENKRDALTALLREDPRPSYQNDPERIYGFPYAGFEVKFTVSNGVLTVCGIDRL